MKSSGVLAVTGLLLCFVILASARRVPLAEDPAAKAEADAKAKALAEGGDVAKAIADAKSKATSTGGQATAKADAKASATAGGGGDGKKDDKETKPTAPKDTDTKPKDEPKGEPKGEPKKGDKDTKPADDKKTKPTDDAPKDDTTGKPKETPKKGSGEPGDGAIDAFLKYTGRCLAPSAPASECAGLSGALCSRKDVKCSANKTEFLDDSGAVVATGTNNQQLVCYTDKSKPCFAA